MKKVLIVGKNSYIGTSFEKYISKFEGYEVSVIDSIDNKWSAVNFSEFDVVFNVSGLCHADSKHGTEEMYYAINSRLPVDIAKKAKSEGVKQFINMSSMIIFGQMSRIGVEKNIIAGQEPQPCNIYGKSKLLAEIGLKELCDENFSVAIMRPPLIYGENARDNFPRLVKFAKIFPIFPDIKNKQSMIYIDNFSELVRLIIDDNASGVFMPQDKEYICVSTLVKDLSGLFGKKMYLTKLFNPLIILLSKRVYLFNKVFGNITYDKKLSNYYDNRYCVTSYQEAIKRIAK